MGEGVETDPHGHAILILRAVRAGVVTLGERAETFTFENAIHRLHLFTDDGSCLTTEMESRIRVALDA